MPGPSPARRAAADAMPEGRRIYRELLRLARAADAEPRLLVPILGRPPRWFNPNARKIARAPMARSPFVEDAIWEACGGSTEFAHPHESRRGAARAVRRHRRRADALGLSASPYSDEAKELMRRFLDAKAVADLVAGPGRELEPEPVADAVPLELDLVPIGDAAPVLVGDFLFTHPLACLGQPALDQAVVLVDEVNEQRDFVHGLVVNAPGHATLGDLIAAWREDGLQDYAGLLHLALWRGGDVAQAQGPREDIRLLHLHGAVPGAREVAPSVWEGGDLAELGRLEDRAKGSPTVGAFIGYCGWSRPQLALELERGVWVRARARTGEAARALCLPPAAGVPPSGAPPGDDPGDPASRRSLLVARPERRVELWRAGLRAAGARSLAEFPRGAGADEHLQELLHQHGRQRMQELTSKD